jgi:hypothetical protein
MMIMITTAMKVNKAIMKTTMIVKAGVAHLAPPGC